MCRRSVQMSWGENEVDGITWCVSLLKWRLVVVAVLEIYGCCLVVDTVLPVWALAPVTTWLGDCLRAGRPTSHLGRLSLLPSVGPWNEYQLSGWEIINGDGSCLQAGQWLKSIGLVQKSAAVWWRCSAFIVWTGWTHAMTHELWCQHCKHCPGRHYYYYHFFQFFIFIIIIIPSVI